MISISAKENGTTLAIRGLENLPQALDQVLAGALDRGLYYAVGIAQTEFLQGPRPAKLGEVTGRLRNSIAHEVKMDGARGITGRIGSNVKYAAFHEFGFSGIVNVKAHTRIAAVLSSGTGKPVEVRRPQKDKAGNFIGYKETRSRAIDRLGAQNFFVFNHQIPAHQRKINYKGKPFAAPALRKAEPLILAELQKALTTLKP